MTGDYTQNRENKSYFTGKALTSLYFAVLSFFASIFTLGLASPLITCMRLQWWAANTYIDGRQLVFTGKAKDLFWKNLKWNALSVMTFGIYLIFKSYKRTKWEISNIHFLGGSPNSDNVSEFTGKWYVYIGINLLTKLITVFTLSVGYYWAYCFKERWYSKNTLIDGNYLLFNGKAKQYFSKRFVWGILSLITLGIFTVLVKGKLMRWKISLTTVLDENKILFYSDAVYEVTYGSSYNIKMQLSCIFTLPTLLFICCGILTFRLSRHDDITAVSFVPIIFGMVCLAFAIVCIAFGILSYKRFGKTYKYDKLFSATFISVNCLVTTAAILLIAFSLIEIVY